MNVSMSDDSGQDYGPEIILSFTRKTDVQYTFCATVGTLVNLSQGYDMRSSDIRVQVVAGNGIAAFPHSQSLLDFSGDAFFITPSCGFASTDTCAGKCGELGTRCHCDSACQSRNDCCGDYVAECMEGDCEYTVEMAASGCGWGGAQFNVTVNAVSIPVSLAQGYEGRVRFGANPGDVVELSSSFGMSLVHSSPQSTFQLAAGTSHSLFNADVPLKYFARDTFVVSDTCSVELALQLDVPTCVDRCGDHDEIAKCQCDKLCQERNDCCPGYVTERTQCVCTIHLDDSYGDGWNGIYVDVSVAESLRHMLGSQQQVMAVTLPTRYNTTRTFGVAVGEIFRLSAPYSGDYYDEASYGVTDAEGNTLVPMTNMNFQSSHLWQVARDCLLLDGSSSCHPESCGGNITDGDRTCFCDIACVEYRDCFLNFQSICTEAPTPAPTAAPTAIATDAPTDVPTTKSSVTPSQVLTTQDPQIPKSSGSSTESSSSSTAHIVAGCAVAVAVVVVCVAVFRAKFPVKSETQRVEPAFENAVYSSRVQIAHDRAVVDV